MLYFQLSEFQGGIGRELILLPEVTAMISEAFYLCSQGQLSYHHLLDLAVSGPKEAGSSKGSPSLES